MSLKPAARWHDQVPGTRWFRADLHLHTLDDHEGGRVALPPGFDAGQRRDPAFLRRYAHALLDQAVARGVEVLGLTPHDVRTGEATSAAWSVVEAWTNDSDTSGRPYRDQIYAVFPGFEPCLNDGSGGLHLIALFDPTIGRARYQRIFDAIMKSIPPWNGNELRPSALDANGFYDVLEGAHIRDNAPDATHWDYLTLAPHAFSGKGLFSAKKGEVLKLFPADRLSGLELGDNQLVEDATANRPWLIPAMKDHRHALFHASDGYSIAPDVSDDALYNVGSRVTILKLNAPTIAALRQSFLGADSRLRLAYRRSDDGRGLTLRTDLPEPCPLGRPWIRSVRVTGGTSFHRDQEFRFSPDLTCVIGGSMTGKSTLLDGLRVRLAKQADLGIVDPTIRSGVERRAKDRFLSGNPTVQVESPALDVSRPVDDRFAVTFFSQGELKTLGDDPERIEELLFRLSPERSKVLILQRDELRFLDRELAELIPALLALEDRTAEAEQALERTSRARDAMERFATAGTARLRAAQNDAARLREWAAAISASRRTAVELVERLEASTMPVFDAELLAGRPAAGTDGADSLDDALVAAAAARDAISHVERRAHDLLNAATERLASVTTEVQATLVAIGGTAADLNEFGAFAKQAQHFESFRAALAGVRAMRDEKVDSFDALLAERARLVQVHRDEMSVVCDALAERFSGRISVSIDREGRTAPLESWVLGLRMKGVTQWWNGVDRQRVRGTTIQSLAEAVEADRREDALRLAGELGMTDAVAKTFTEVMATRAKRLEARAMRTPDRYTIRWNEGGESKNLESLSGGRKVAILLSMILESDDATPLVIDQPEDELDNRFLNETIIPTLHRLKGRRQVVFATHNANIVVNGDADQVIVLEADATRGRVLASGAIENPEVRDAIVSTLDGGDEAFRLRRAKYGF